MRLEELRDLGEADGLLILTTANDDDLTSTLLDNGFSFDLGTSDRLRKMWWLHRSVGDYEAHLRYHPHNDSKFAPELYKEGFITRIDFFVRQPTRVIYDIVSALLHAGHKVASPRPAGTHILGEWEIFEP